MPSIRQIHVPFLHVHVTAGPVHIAIHKAKILPTTPPTKFGIFITDELPVSEGLASEFVAVAEAACLLLPPVLVADGIESSVVDASEPCRYFELALSIIEL